MSLKHLNLIIEKSFSSSIKFFGIPEDKKEIFFMTMKVKRLAGPNFYCFLDSNWENEIYWEAMKKEDFSLNNCLTEKEYK